MVSQRRPQVQWTRLVCIFELVWSASLGSDSITYLVTSIVSSSDSQSLSQILTVTHHCGCALLCVSTTQDSDEECRRTIARYSPDSHLYTDALELVDTTGNAMTEEMPYKRRKQIVSNSPLRRRLQCLTCGGPCEVPLVCLCYAGPPCTPWSRAGLQLAEEDPICELHLKWLLVHSFLTVK